MEHAIEGFVAITSLIVGASHLVWADAWVEVFRAMHRGGRPAAFANGGLSLVPGAAIVAGHWAWSWPGGVLTAFGWLLVAKGLIGLLAPNLALRSMERGPSPAGFRAGGVLLMAVGAWAGYCFWRGGVSG
jgi:hypothetical protein